jgi:hypothetical protein
LVLAGWLNRHHQLAIEYLREDNRVLREMLGTRRLRFTTPSDVGSLRLTLQ